MGKSRKEIAVEAFENNDALNTVFVTKDNQPFGVISDAQNYASKFKTPEDRKLETFTREELKVKKVKTSTNRVVDALKAIKECKTAEEVNALTAKEIRPFVLAQAKIKLKELGVGDAPATQDTSELDALKKQNEQLQKFKAAAEKLAATEKKRADTAEKKLKAKDTPKKEAPKKETEAAKDNAATEDKEQTTK